IPEIIALVGRFIPLWTFKEDIYTRTSSTRDVFQPRDLLSAALVNRTFHRTLTPLLWHVYDDFLVCSVNSNEYTNYYKEYYSESKHHVRIPPNILFAHCQHFRIFHNTFRVLAKGRNLPPLQYICTHLQELTLSMWVEDDLACDLILKNPALRLLSWECSNYSKWDYSNPASRVMNYRNYEALSALHRLETLHLRMWVIDHKKLWKAVLRRNVASLKELSFEEMLGFKSERMWGSFAGGSHWDREEEEEDDQDGDHQRYSGNKVTTMPDVLFSKLKTLRLDCLWGVSTFPSTKMKDAFISDNTALPGLLRYCPALEILFLRPEYGCDMDRVGRLLREYCPRLDTIRCVDGYSVFYSNDPMDNSQYIHLIQGCTPLPSPLLTAPSVSTDDADVSSGTEHDLGRRGLKYLEMGFALLDTTITSTLLAHASSLQIVELYLSGDNKMDYENACRLLQFCSRLKRFGMHGHSRGLRPLDGLLLFQHEWGCQQLESLQLKGFANADMPVYEFSVDEEDEQEEQGEAQLDGQFSDHCLEQGQDQIYTVDEEAMKLGLVDAFGVGRSLASSNTSSATAARNDYHKFFTPGHWRIAWEPRFGKEKDLHSVSGDMFQRALFQRADSLPNLVHLILNERHYTRNKSN
ncbi:hypothetical protein BGZ98_003994, partial [Dissophora globulifera]